MVIYTYSVIIQNKMSTEAFMKHQPLFMDVLNNNRIGVCKWNESGTTIDTAVPELRDLTDDKEEWNAFIVRFAEDKSMAEFEADEQNPYDFLINSDAQEDYTDSQIPLIRLTHMLGTVPAPEMEFVSEEICENGKAPRVVYKPVENKEKEVAYKEFCQRYAFDGVLPSSIVMITVREGYDTKGKVASAWREHREVKSSKFWKRNLYPSNSRFLVYDFEKKGPVQRNADEFGFWLSVMLLASNKIDSGVLQAYRLYNLKTRINKEQMAECFQETVDRLKSARYVIEREIRKEVEKQLSVESKLPAYRLEVPVSIKLPGSEERTVNEANFGLLSKGITTELSAWNSEKKEIEDWLDTSIRKVERTLDLTANRIRECGTFTEDEVTCLDRYQMEDMERETSDIYREIVDIQGKLPITKASDNPAIAEAEEKVFENLRIRVVWKNALIALGLAMVLIVLGQIPAIINLIVNEVGSIWYILGTILISWLIVIGAAFLVAAVQSAKTQKLLDRYNELMRGTFNRLVDEASIFSQYLTNIASHSRGYSYMNLSKRKKHLAENANVSKYRHIKAVNVFLSKIKTWSVAYHLDVDFEESVINEYATVNTNISPAHSNMYTFETGGAYSVEVNKTGETIVSSFAFVDAIEIVREELYDDDESR